MSDQLTLAGVEVGQYFRAEEYGTCNVYYIGDAHSDEVLWWFRSTQTGAYRSMTREFASKLPVELMELVPSDREQSLRPWEKAEHIDKPWECVADFDAWLREKLAPQEGIDPENDAAWERFLEESPALTKATLYSVFCDAVDEARKPADRESDLLEALEAIDDDGESYLSEENWNQLRAAIAKYKREPAKAVDL